MSTDHDYASDALLGANNTQAQDGMLVNLFSLPMLWEEAQWIGLHQGLSRGVPVHLLVDIPSAMGSHKEKEISTLSIRTTMAPDYRSLFGGQHSLTELKAAVTSLRVSQVTFEPGDSSLTSPWNPYDVGTHGLELYLEGNAAHMAKLDRYIGALVSHGGITSVEVDLKRFWYCLSIDEGRFMGLGNAWCLEPAPCLRNLTLSQIPMSLASLKRLTMALDEQGSLHLDRVLLDGSWEAALTMLRRNMHGYRDVLIRSVFSAVVDDPNNTVHAYPEGWAVPSEDEDGAAEHNSGERYVLGEDIPNPAVRTEFIEF